MKEEEEPKWFSKFEAELPSPDELMPLSQTLITPDLALAFDIPPFNSRPRDLKGVVLSQPISQHLASSSQHNPQQPQAQHQQDYDSSEIAGGAPGDDQARTLKRPRLVWTPQLHKRFVDAVAHLGIKNAVPKTIMQLMSVDGLTRENVASHLQKYRLYLKRMQGLSSSSNSGHADPATEQLFASGPVPHHFLARPAEQFVPFVPQQPQMALHHHQHQQYYQQRTGFDYVPRQPVRMVGPGIAGQAAIAGQFGEEFDRGRPAGAERRVLTLFPTNED